MMTGKNQADLRDIARVLASGTVSYLLVHIFLLPALIRWGVSFPTYFYIGVLATGVVAVVLGYAVRARPDATADHESAVLHPAE